MEINNATVTKILDVIDAGLVYGVGDPEPGQLCVLSAICFALGEPHGDKPSCVGPILRQMQIRLNDWVGWKSSEERALALRRLAIASLGSAGKWEEEHGHEFLRWLAQHCVRVLVPRVFREAAAFHPEQLFRERLLSAATMCEEAEGEPSHAVEHAEILAETVAETIIDDLAVEGTLDTDRDALHGALCAAKACVRAASYAQQIALATLKEEDDWGTMVVACAVNCADEVLMREEMVEFTEACVGFLVESGCPGIALLWLTELDKRISRALAEPCPEGEEGVPPEISTIENMQRVLQVAADLGISIFRVTTHADGGMFAACDEYDERTLWTYNEDKEQPDDVVACVREECESGRREDIERLLQFAVQRRGDEGD